MNRKKKANKTLVQFGCKIDTPNLRLKVLCKRNKKKTMGKNVGHKDADNKVWGDREAALLRAKCWESPLAS